MLVHPLSFLPNFDETWYLWIEVYYFYAVQKFEPSPTSRSLIFHLTVVKLAIFVIYLLPEY